MSEPMPSRRDFLATGGHLAGGGWLLLNLPLIATLAACARDAASTGEVFTTLTPAEAAAMRAFAARILPSEDGEPGAEEAGAVYFVDRILAGPFAAMSPLIQPGLADLDQRAAARGAASFATLSAPDQDSLLREVEDTPFFINARMLTVMGVLADPSYGGNRNDAGARLYGIEHAPAYRPPFGYYDAEAAGQGGVA
jgi:gluconate 2-dehydrogenase gamma chain